LGSLLLAVQPPVGETLVYDLTYVGFNSGYMKVKAVAEMSLEEFLQQKNVQPYAEFYQNIIPKINTANEKVVLLRVETSVEQLDKAEDIYMLSGANLPLFFQQYAFSGAETITLFDPFTYKTKTISAEETKVRSFPSPVTEPITFLYYMRNHRSNNYQLLLSDQEFSYSKIGEETLKYQGKDVPTIILKSEPTKMRIWLSNDDRRLPLQLAYDFFLGSVMVTLR
jgi:hypothetical protein